jgi:hypothetical protein
MCGAGLQFAAVHIYICIYPRLSRAILAGTGVYSSFGEGRSVEFFLYGTGCLSLQHQRIGIETTWRA